jgi:hypothetical protein
VASGGTHHIAYASVPRQPPVCIAGASVPAKIERSRRNATLLVLVQKRGKSKATDFHCVTAAATTIFIVTGVFSEEVNR